MVYPRIDIHEDTIDDKVEFYNICSSLVPRGSTGYPVLDRWFEGLLIDLDIAWYQCSYEV